MYITLAVPMLHILDLMHQLDRGYRGNYNNMDRVQHILNLITLALAFLSLLAPKTKSQEANLQAVPGQPLPQRPLCPQQFALANYACSRLPFSPLPPPQPGPAPTPPSPDGPGPIGHRGGEGHRRHGHRHGHNRHRRRDTPEENNCCRWAREVDAQCVCELLLRLPPFLVRPVHQYTVLVGDVCEIIYPCGGPI